MSKRKNYPFHKLTTKDWQAGAQLGLNNAKDILKSSQLCKENGLHAVGNSLMISATEELIKALYLRIRAVTGKEPIPGFQKLFFDHKEKHHQIIRQISIQYSKHFENKSKEDVKAAVIGLVVLGVFSAYALSQREDDDRNPYNIEENRQAGLYLDFHKTKLQWLVPKEEIKPESFENYFNMITTFFNTVEAKYFSIETKENVEKLLKDLIKMEKEE